MDTATLHPDIITHWQKITHKLEKKRLPHAWSIFGEQSVVVPYAKLFAKSLLCQQTAVEVCGNCQSCRWFSENIHPEFYIYPQDVKMTIEDARSLQQEMYKPPQIGGFKVVLIANAHLLSLQVANALLKTLEEPQSNSVLLLTAPQKHSLMQTLSSRTLNIMLPEIYNHLTDDTHLSQNLSHQDLNNLNYLQINPSVLAAWEQVGFCNQYDVILRPFFKNHRGALLEGSKLFHDYPQESLYLLYRWLAIGGFMYTQEQEPNLLKPVRRFIALRGMEWYWEFYSVLLSASKKIAQLSGINKQLLFEQLVYQWWLGECYD